ncbi:MAG: carboxypeptidase-like regulatory domain-containing protein [Chitinophagaceae bacterium]|nr:carboxypeptidase-like regulatory domain-containing protein [Chitinophagaceae bacterium]
MKFVIQLLLISFTVLHVNAQQRNFLIMGKVIDSATQQPLSGASVFAQNTTYGTTCNADGVFGLKLPNGGYDLVISYTGYEKKSIRVSNTQQLTDSIIFPLVQINNSLSEVAVVATNEVQNGWERFGQFFFDNFIGTTPNAAKCVIVNPQSLHFFYTKNKKRHRLKVTADQDLMIQNNALGYLIRYQLDSFSYDYNSNISQYTGSPFFIETDTVETVKEEWKKNRARTYLGSRLHFMTSLYDSTVNDEGFFVEKLEGDGSDAKGTFIEDLYDSTLYSVDSNSVVINWEGRYRISYKSVFPDKKFLQEFKLPENTKVQVTLLDVAGPFVIEENGYFYEQYDVTNTGYWAWKKLAESLPYDYGYE